jgi:membrane protein implicated in regulation of membrane protease activity
VRNITRKARLGLRLPVLGVIAGIVVIAFTFTANTFVALAGFALLVASATVLVHSIRARNYETDSEDETNSQSAKRGRRRFGRA